MATGTVTTDEAPSQGGFFAWIERVGNKVPHPVMMFLYLILGVMVLSHILFLFGVSVTDEIVTPVNQATVEQIRGALGGSVVAYNPDTSEVLDIPQFTVEQQTIPIRSLLTADGIRHIFVSFQTNFTGFAPLGVIFLAMLGAGVAEQAGMMNALIRKMVAVTPAGWLTFAMVLIGVISSIASDAGYLILIPLAAAAFASVGRHPLAGLAAAFAGVSAVFTVNFIPTPIDAMITEITNAAIVQAGGQPITLGANLYWNIASSIVMAVVATVVTTRIIEPRLGKWSPADGDEGAGPVAAAELSEEQEAKGLRWALYAFLGMLALVLLLRFIPGGPLQKPAGQIGGNSPVMDSLLFIITTFFLVTGIAFGKAVGTIKGSGDVIKYASKTFGTLGGMVLMFLAISQFIAFFNYSNMPTVLAVNLAELLGRANIGALPLLLLMTVVITFLNLIMPGAVPKWAIFAPIFVPLFIRLGVEPQSVLAAYRIGDSPTNVITPLMVYLAVVLAFAQRWVKSAGMGTLIALMLPYTVAIAIAWLILLVIFFVFNIPLGPGYLPQSAAVLGLF